MNDNRLLQVQAPTRQVLAGNSDVERVRRHVAKIRMQIQELERRLRHHTLGFTEAHTR